MGIEEYSARIQKKLVDLPLKVAEPFWYLPRKREHGVAWEVSRSSRSSRQIQPYGIYLRDPSFFVG